MRTPLVLALIALGVLVEVESSSSRAQRPSSGQVELIRRRGSAGQRGRRKNIWSYNPGHRSLAFLVAGEVEMASPPPMEAVTGGEYRCLGCCGEKTPISVKTTPHPEPSNRVGQIARRPGGLGVIGSEPNSVIDLCLGCCKDSVTTNPRVTTTPRVTTNPRVTTKPRVTTNPRVTPMTAARQAGGATNRAGQGMKSPAAGGQLARPAQRGVTQKKPCTPPHCNPNWRYEASSSSEEMAAVRRPPTRSRMQPLQSRMGSRRCRQLGCRSPLGSIADDSSSSEEDD